MQNLRTYKLPRLTNILAGYLSIALLGAATIYLIQYLMSISGIDLNLQQLYRIKPIQIALLLVFLVIFSVYFSISQFIFRHLHKINNQIELKITGTLLGLGLLIVLFYFGPIKLPLIPLGLSFLIYITLLDLYQDRRALNSTWVITWMVLISAFLGLLVFDIDLKLDIDRRLQKVEGYLAERNLSIENELRTGDLKEEEKQYDLVKFGNNTPLIENMKADMIKVSPVLWFHPLTGDYLLDNPTEGKHGLWIPLNNPTGKQKKALILGNYQLFYNNKLLITHGDELAYDLTELPELENNPGHFILDQYSYVLFAQEGGLVLIQSEKFPGILRPVSLFSLFFFLLSVLLFLLSLINSIWRFMPEKLDLRMFHKQSLRSRIQISIISLIIISFLVIGAISHYYLQTMARESDRFAQLDHADLVMHRLTSELFTGQMSASTDQLKLLARRELQLGRDQLIFFNESGNLLDHTGENTGQVYGRKVPKNIIRSLKSDPTLKVYDYQSVGKQGVYLSLAGFGQQNWFAYIPGTPMLSGSGKISDIFAALLSIYTLLFILSGAIAIGLSNSITRPIELLGKKLKGLKLSRKNEPVQWKNEDEIGALIAIYNDMIQKLSDNAKVMAKIERDSAWKEMAKQVAHEIKNPLTPLKLNIQYLEAKIRMNPDDAGDLINQISPGLIEQIDNLSQIASEFSNFAQLPTARNEKLRLNEIVKTVHDFFRKREDLTFQLFVPINDILVFADRNHLVRILNNVVKNAIQAIPPDREGEIILRLFKKGSDAIIQVSDNGSGIPLEMQDKVFSPNFTTKSSGTGLGLAISQNMLESFNGRIYFETEENQGTDFFIEIPLMRLEDNFSNENKVFLDD